MPTIRRATVLAAAFLLVAGCTPASGLPPASLAAARLAPAGVAPGIVPWLDAPARMPATSPSPSPAPALTPPPGLRICAAQDLHVVESVVKAAAGTSAFQLRIVAAGLTACRLPPAPRLELLDVAGQPLATTNAAGASSVMLAPNGHPVVLQVLAHAACTGAALDGVRGVATLRAVVEPKVVLSASLPASVNPKCPVSGSAYYDLPVTPAPPAGLSATVHLPSRAAPGSVLVYTVTLQTDSSTTVRGPNCPVYQQILSVGPARVVDETFLLNCTAGTLPPNTTRTFEMRLAVPANAPAASGAKLSWHLVWSGGDTVAGGTIDIVAG